MTGSVTSLPSLSIAHSGTKHTRTHAGPSQDYIITCCPLHTHSHADAGTSSFRTAAGSTTATHTRHTGGITKQQGCDGSADSRCLRSTPLPTQWAAAADAGGKEVSWARGRAQTARDRQTARGEGERKGRSRSEGMAPTATSRQSARPPLTQGCADKTTPAHQQMARRASFIIIAICLSGACACAAVPGLGHDTQHAIAGDGAGSCNRSR